MATVFSERLHVKCMEIEIDSIKYDKRTFNRRRYSGGPSWWPYPEWSSNRPMPLLMIPMSIYNVPFILNIVLIADIHKVMVLIVILQVNCKKNMNWWLRITWNAPNVPKERRQLSGPLSQSNQHTLKPLKNIFKFIFWVMMVIWQITFFIFISRNSKVNMHMWMVFNNCWKWYKIRDFQKSQSWLKNKFKYIF